MPTTNEEASGTAAAATSTTTAAAATTGPALEPAAVEVEGKSWEKGALIVANGPVPHDEKRPVIVVETRDDDGKLDDKRAYPTAGDLYYRTDPDVDFGDGRHPVATLGVDVFQGALHGLSEDPSVVNVGPFSPIYAAINLAYARGARKIEVRGLTKTQKEKLEPWLKHIETRGTSPHATAPVLKEPFDLKITLS